VPIPGVPTSSGAGFGTPATGAVADGARRSLRNTRRLLLKALQSLTVVTTTSAGNAAGTSVVATRLATAMSASRYKGAWVMPVEGAYLGELSRVKIEDALNLTTGELTVSPAFSGQVESGVQVEISRLLPPIDDDGWTGARTCLNDALREMWTPQRLAITGVNGQPSYSLSTYEEWLDPDGVLELRRQALDTTLNAMPAGYFDAVRDADTLSMQISPTLAPGDASTAEVYRPLDTWIKVGGVWGASTTGYVNDSDEALVNIDLLVVVALAHAYESLASGPDGGRYDDLAKRQRLKANVTKQMHLDHRQRRLHTHQTTGAYSYDPKAYETWRPSNY
jgi:hypothetical protein